MPHSVHTISEIDYNVLMSPKIFNVITAVRLIIFVSILGKLNILQIEPSSKSQCNIQLDGSLVGKLVLTVSPPLTIN
jgi:hypothetical protein